MSQGNHSYRSCDHLKCVWYNKELHVLLCLNLIHLNLNSHMCQWLDSWTVQVQCFSVASWCTDIGCFDLIFQELSAHLQGLIEGQSTLLRKGVFSKLYTKSPCCLNYSWQQQQIHSLLILFDLKEWTVVDFVVQSLGRVRLLATPWTGACQVPLSFTSSRSLLKLLSIESMMLSNHLIFCPQSFLPSCPQSLPESVSFPISRLFASGSQSIRASASASVLPMNTQGWFPLGLTGLISLQSKGLSKSLHQPPQFETIKSLVFSLL